MALEQTRDDSSHYEVSLTAGQAFIAFVLLLFSLAASFAFGVIIGREQNGEPLIARTEKPAVVAQGKASRETPQIVELGVGNEPAARIIEEEPPVVKPKAAVPAAEPVRTTAVEPSSADSEPPSATAPAPRESTGSEGPWYAQLLSTSDVKSAEALAARLIDNGYTSAYVQRNAGEQGNVFRVRVRFPDEVAARAAATPLKAFSKGDVWVTRR